MAIKPAGKKSLVDYFKQPDMGDADPRYNQGGERQSEAVPSRKPAASSSQAAAPRAKPSGGGGRKTPTRSPSPSRPGANNPLIPGQGARPVMGPPMPMQGPPMPFQGPPMPPPAMGLDMGIPQQPLGPPAPPQQLGPPIPPPPMSPPGLGAADAAGGIVPPTPMPIGAGGPPPGPPGAPLPMRPGQQTSGPPGGFQAPPMAPADTAGGIVPTQVAAAQPNPTVMGPPPPGLLSGMGDYFKRLMTTSGTP